MDYRILGPLGALDGERQLPLGGAKQRAVLAVLLLHDPGEHAVKATAHTKKRARLRTRSE